LSGDLWGSGRFRKDFDSTDPAVIAEAPKPTTA